MNTRAAVMVVIFMSPRSPRPPISPSFPLTYLNLALLLCPPRLPHIHCYVPLPLPHIGL